MITGPCVNKTIPILNKTIKFLKKSVVFGTGKEPCSGIPFAKGFLNRVTDQC